MTPVGRRETALLAEHLDAGETVHGQVIANFGQTVVATSRKVLIVKAGISSGRAFGGRATTFDDGDIEEIELRMGIAQGEFEILTWGGEHAPAISRCDVNQLPNAVVFGKARPRCVHGDGSQDPRVVGPRRPTAGGPVSPDPACSTPPAPLGVRAPDHTGGRYPKGSDTE